MSSEFESNVWVSELELYLRGMDSSKEEDVGSELSVPAARSIVEVRETDSPKQRDVGSQLEVYIPRSIGTSDLRIKADDDCKNCDVCTLLNTVKESSPSNVVKKYTSKHRIQEVPKRLREVKSNHKCFDPVLVSIGPYHHGKPEYQITEKLKYVSANRLVSYCKCELKTLYNVVANLVHAAKDSYAYDIQNKFSDSEFANMMFLDGCFILDFIRVTPQRKRFDLMGDWCSSDLIRADLFLLENQLPFFVLEALMAVMFNGGHGWEAMISNFMDDFVIHFCGRQQNPHPVHFIRRPIHLLDLVRETLFYNPSCLFFHDRDSFELRSFASVKELKEQGINFRRSNRGLGVIDFSSSRLYGELSLLPLAINESTKSLLLNIAAYEMCPDVSLRYVATSYIRLMTDLIKNAEDVKELRSEDIIFNSFGSDAQVADIFSKLSDQLMQDPTIYASLAAELDHHLGRTLQRSLVSFINANFASRTSIIVMAVSLGLFLTLLQTI